MPDGIEVEELIRGLSPAALKLFKQQLPQRLKELAPEDRNTALATLSRMPEFGEEVAIEPPTRWLKPSRGVGVQEFLPGEAGRPRPGQVRTLGEMVREREAGAQPFMPTPPSELVRAPGEGIPWLAPIWQPEGAQEEYKRTWLTSEGHPLAPWFASPVGRFVSPTIGAPGQGGLLEAALMTPMMAPTGLGEVVTGGIRAGLPLIRRQVPALAERLAPEARRLLTEEAGFLGKPAVPLKTLATPTETAALKSLQGTASKAGFDLEAIEGIAPGEYWVSLTRTRKPEAADLRLDWLKSVAKGLSPESEKVIADFSPLLTRQKPQKTFLPFKNLQDAKTFLETGDASLIAKKTELRGEPWSPEKLAETQAAMARMPKVSPERARIELEIQRTKAELNVISPTDKGGVAKRRELTAKLSELEAELEKFPSAVEFLKPTQYPPPEIKKPAKVRGISEAQAEARLAALTAKMTPEEKAAFEITVKPEAKAPEVAKPVSPEVTRRYIIKEEPEPLYKSGKKYVLYSEDGTPRYLAAETPEALQKRLIEAEPNAEIIKVPTVAPGIPEAKVAEAVKPLVEPPKAPPPPFIVKPPSPGKPFKVPEVPLAKETIADLRLRHPERLKAPDATLTVVEEARNVHLYNQEIGNNAIAPIMSHLRAISPNSKALFGIEEGIVSKVGNPHNLSLAWGDVFENYTKYTLNAEQKEYIRTLHGIVDGLKTEATKHGIKIPELQAIDEMWHYVPRKVVGAGGITEPFVRVGAAPLRGKTSFMKKRVFELMEEGLKEGKTYANPEETMESVITGYYRLIANKQAEEILKTITRVGKPKVGEVPISVLSWFYPVKGGVAIQQRVAMREVANAINRSFRPEEVPEALRIASQISRGQVTAVASMDLSRSWIQGLMTLGKDFQLALKGKPSAIWARSLGNEIKAILNPQNAERILKENYDTISEMVSHGVITSGSEFYAGLTPMEKIAGKIPIAGKVLPGAMKQTYRRFQAGWNTGSIQSRILLWKVMREPWLREGGNLRELGEVINKMTGVISSKTLGVGAVQRASESTVVFAPNWLRANLMILRDLTRSNMTGKEMRTLVAATLGAMTVGYGATSLALGQRPKLNPLPKRYGGDGAEMFTVRIGDSNIGIPGLIYFWLKTLVEIGATAAEDPDRLIKFNTENPIVRIATYKLAPGVNLARELLTGKDFAGNELRNTQDYLAEVVKSIIPIASQQILEPKPTLPALAAEFAGLREFPTGVLDKLAQKEYNKNWSMLSPVEKGTVRNKYSQELTEGKMPREERIRRETQAVALKQQQARDAIFIKTLQAVQQGIRMPENAMTGRQWREAYYQGQAELAAKLEQFDVDFQRMRREPKTLEEKVLSGYYALQDNFRDPQTGLFDSEGWRGAERQYFSQLPPNLKNYIETNLNPYATPLVKAFKAVQKIIEPYWEIEDQVWAGYDPKLKQISDQIIIIGKVDERKAKQMLFQYPQIAMARQLIALHRKRLLMQRPDIDKALDAFYR